MFKHVLKIFCSIAFLLSGCTLTQDYENLESTQNFANSSRISFETFKKLQERGNIYFNYSSNYWMYGNFSYDYTTYKQTFIADIQGQKEKRKFIRNNIDVIFHPNTEKYGNQIIIDFGKSYDENLKRFLYIKLENNKFRGKMLDFIKWNNSTDFEIWNNTKTVDGVVDTFYNDVPTGSSTIVEKPLPYGEFESFDKFRDNEVLYFDYCIKNGVKYRMWIDLRIGLENYMELIYHKVGILNQRFLSQRKV
ncbi:MAG: hypothetical protein ACRCTJ_01765, partial [Brevinema sp.]